MRIINNSEDFNKLLKRDDLIGKFILVETEKGKYKHIYLVEDIELLSYKELNFSGLSIFLIEDGGILFRNSTKDDIHIVVIDVSNFSISCNNSIFCNYINELKIMEYSEIKNIIKEVIRKQYFNLMKFISK